MKFKLLLLFIILNQFQVLSQNKDFSIDERKKYTVTEFANLTRQKFPGSFDDFDDISVTRIIISQHPVYKSWIDYTDYYEKRKKEEKERERKNNIEILFISILFIILLITIFILKKVLLIQFKKLFDNYFEFIDIKNEGFKRLFIISLLITPIIFIPFNNEFGFDGNDRGIMYFIFIPISILINGFIIKIYKWVKDGF